MTLAKAQEVVAAIVGVGYQIDRCSQDGTGSWFVQASAVTGDVNINTIATFATNHGVAAATSGATFT